MKAWIFIGFIALSCTAQASLIINGSFEQNDIRKGSWAYFNSAQVNGWQGDNIEIWDNVGRIEATDGQQIAELNAHCNRGSKPCPQGGANYSIFQDFESVAGSSYLLGFDYRARTNKQESFSVSLIDKLGETLLDNLFDDHTNKQWSSFASRFQGTGETLRLRFTSLTKGTYGNLLDNISVQALQTRAVVRSFAAPVPQTQISEPASLSLFAALGVILLAYRPAKQKTRRDLGDKA